MIRVFLLTFVLIISIYARENPFFPSKGEKDLPVTANDYKIIPKLQKATMKVPANARLIKKVTIGYENLDATTEIKSIDLNNAIDWHLPIFISQSYAEQKAKFEEPKAGEKKKEKTYKKIAEFKYAKFFTLKKNLRIKIEDKLLRNFLLAQPHRIVMDFERDDSIKSYIKSIPGSAFTKIRVGNHKGYYRVVIELDGYYRYKLEKLTDGCLITLE